MASVVLHFLFARKSRVFAAMTSLQILAIPGVSMRFAISHGGKSIGFLKCVTECNTTLAKAIGLREVIV